MTPQRLAGERVLAALIRHHTPTTEKPAMTPQPNDPRLALERVLEARWALFAAAQAHGLVRDYPDTFRAFDALAELREVLEGELEADEVIESPWRHVATASEQPEELVRMLERVLRNAGTATITRPGSLHYHLCELHDRVRLYLQQYGELSPEAGRKLAHHAVAVAVILELAGEAPR